MPGVEQARAYHLLPAEASKARAIAMHMQIRGLQAGEVVAIGDSREDAGAAEVVQTFWFVANAVAKDPTLRSIRGHNIRIAQESWGAGVYEAVVTELAERALADHHRRTRPQRRCHHVDGVKRAGGGVVVRTRAIHPSSGSSPEIRPASAVRIGASTPARVSARASSGTRSSDSTAWPMRAGISAAGTPSASSSPARRLRLCGASDGADEVAGARQPDQRLRAARPGARRSARPRGTRARPRRRRR